MHQIEQFLREGCKKLLKDEGKITVNFGVVQWFMGNLCTLLSSNILDMHDIFRIA